MEAILSAIMSDLLSRVLSMVIQRYRRSRAQEADNGIQRLQRLLLRVDATVEEAEGRHITNQAMLRQLEMLRQGMYGGHYVLDTVKFRGHGGDDEVSGGLPVALPRFSSAKRLPSSTGNSSSSNESRQNPENLKNLEKMLESLETLMGDMLEFAVFLEGYPRIRRQPYCTYLILGNVMFGRQMEMETVINFLLRPETPSGNGGPGVLPIVGVARIGKSTLVEHVCLDERVRSHFSSIVVFTGEDLDAGDLAAFRGSAAIKHQDATAAASHGRSLAVIELAGDVDEGAWRRLYHSASSSMGHGSKIVIAGRSEKVAALGTTRALRLQALPREAYWYFFKALAFGSANPDDHPKLASLAMEIAELLDGAFMAGNVVASLMRANQSTEFWLRVLQCSRDYTRKHQAMFGSHPNKLLQQGQTVYPWRMAGARDVVTTFCKIYQKPPAQDEDGVPEVTVQDILSGRSTRKGNFSAVAWVSTVPPYCTFLASCVSQTVRCSTATKKRPRHARV